MELSGWGRCPTIDAKVCPSYNVNRVRQCLTQHGSWISYGLGRSYGDSALNEQALLLKYLNRVLKFDESNGILTCESGVTLSEIADIFLTRGWFLSITPGTKHITVGGAIASNVHGKNHHIAGSFISCVQSIDLMMGDGQIITCSREENHDLFFATFGGMGLTGVILRATVQLKKVNSAYIRQKTIKARNLEEIFDLFEEYSDWTYSVAWLDCLCTGMEQGKSLLMLGEHANDYILRYKKKRKISIPIDMPRSTLNMYSVLAFNKLYYNKKRKDIVNSVSTLESFFYPLDSIHNWNRIYGKKGFTQYQFVLPKENSYKGLQEILTQISKTGLGSFLTVLKLFGHEEENYLSFPMKGYTLALDFKIQSNLFPLLEKLDQIVLNHGGRLYLTKDSRMSEDMLNKGYPMADEFRNIRIQYNLKSKFSSCQSKRLRI